MTVFCAVCAGLIEPCDLWMAACGCALCGGCATVFQCHACRNPICADDTHRLAQACCNNSDTREDLQERLYTKLALRSYHQGLIDFTRRALQYEGLLADARAFHKELETESNQLQWRKRSLEKSRFVGRLTPLPVLAPPVNQPLVELQLPEPAAKRPRPSAPPTPPSPDRVPPSPPGSPELRVSTPPSALQQPTLLERMRRLRESSAS